MLPSLRQQSELLRTLEHACDAPLLARLDTCEFARQDGARLADEPREQVEIRVPDVVERHVFERVAKLAAAAVHMVLYDFLLEKGQLSAFAQRHAWRHALVELAQPLAHVHLELEQIGPGCWREQVAARASTEGNPLHRQQQGTQESVGMRASEAWWGGDARLLARTGLRPAPSPLRPPPVPSPCCLPCAFALLLAPSLPLASLASMVVAATGRPWTANSGFHPDFDGGSRPAEHSARVSRAGAPAPRRGLQRRRARSMGAEASCTSTPDVLWCNTSTKYKYQFLYSCTAVRSLKSTFIYGRGATEEYLTIFLSALLPHAHTPHNPTRTV